MCFLAKKVLLNYTPLMIWALKVWSIPAFRTWSKVPGSLTSQLWLQMIDPQNLDDWNVMKNTRQIIRNIYKNLSSLLAPKLHGAIAWGKNLQHNYITESNRNRAYQVCQGTGWLKRANVKCKVWPSLLVVQSLGFEKGGGIRGHPCIPNRFFLQKVSENLDTRSITKYYRSESRYFVSLLNWVWFAHWEWKDWVQLLRSVGLIRPDK